MAGLSTLVTMMLTTLWLFTVSFVDSFCFDVHVCFMKIPHSQDITVVCIPIFDFGGFLISRGAEKALNLHDGRKVLIHA
jgi:hypothetical protein